MAEDLNNNQDDNKQDGQRADQTTEPSPVISEDTESTASLTPASSSRVAESTSRVQRDYTNLPESEPYLGPGWAVLMLMLYGLKEAFPTDRFTLLWWAEIYVLLLVAAMTIFIILKRRAYFKRLKQKQSRDL